MADIIYPVTIAPVVKQAPSDSSEEYLPVVEESGIVTSQAPRSYIHDGSKLLHPVVHLHLIDREGRICLQKRSMNKSLLPGWWDTSVGGHVSYGESIQEALYREASEELGLYDFNPIQLKSYVWESATERELVFVFAVVGKYALTPDPDEVDECRWWSSSELEKSFGKGVLTPNFENEYRMIADSLQALL